MKDRYLICAVPPLRANVSIASGVLVSPAKSNVGACSPGRVPPGFAGASSGDQFQAAVSMAARIGPAEPV